MRMRPEADAHRGYADQHQHEQLGRPACQGRRAAERHRHEQRDTEAKDHDGFQRRHDLEQGKCWAGVFKQRAFQHFGFGFGDVERHDAEIGRIKEGEGGNSRPHHGIEEECPVRLLIAARFP